MRSKRKGGEDSIRIREGRWEFVTQSKSREELHDTAPSTQDTVKRNPVSNRCGI
jgi:hypothetical protein